MDDGVVAGYGFRVAGTIRDKGEKELRISRNPQVRKTKSLTQAAGLARIRFPMRVYLSGAIEHAPDHGKLWRSQLTPFLQELGHEVYDPALDERKNLTEEEVRNFRDWKTTDLARFQQTIRKIIAFDLDKIEQGTDYIICHWDEYAQRGAGTQAELTFAHRLGIPVYLVCGVPIVQVSGWILGCSNQVFSSFEHLRSFMLQYFASYGVASGAAVMKG